MIKNIREKEAMKKLITSQQSIDARESLGLSQNYVSQQTGVGRSYMSQFENGHRSLTEYQAVKLRSFYEGEGFVFDFKATHGVFNSEVEKAQDSLSSIAVEGGSVELKALDISDLLSSLEHIVEASYSSSPVEENGVDIDGVDESFKQVLEDFEAGNKILEDYFLLDAKGKIKAPTFFESRDYRCDKIISIMAFQYMRYLAVKSGSLFFGDEFLSEFSTDEILKGEGFGKDATAISVMIGSRVDEETSADNYLGGFVS